MSLIKDEIQNSFYHEHISVLIKISDWNDTNKFPQFPIFRAQNLSPNFRHHFSLILNTLKIENLMISYLSEILYQTTFEIFLSFEILQTVNILKKKNYLLQISANLRIYDIIVLCTYEPIRFTSTYIHERFSHQLNSNNLKVRSHMVQFFRFGKTIFHSRVYNIEKKIRFSISEGANHICSDERSVLGAIQRDL